MKTMLLGWVSMVVVLGTGTAQGTWSLVANTGPTPRWDTAMSYDSQRNRMVLFGGLSNLGYVGDTWERIGSTWVQVASTGPAARSKSAMAYDSQRGRVVLFGGTADASNTYGDTWEWSGGVWVQVATTGPLPRIDHAMAYDSQRGRTVLFGGADPGAYVGDTWEWSGSNWLQVANSGPPARGEHAMAYDSQRGRTVLFGGSDALGWLGDTWEWDSVSWQSISGAQTISPRQMHTMCYDGQRQRVVLFGGHGASPIADETWEWNGTRWYQVFILSAPPSPSRHMHVMAFDTQVGHVLVFGGYSLAAGGSLYLSDTWELTMAPPATSSFNTFGSGCVGPNGIPQLTAVPGVLPIIGTVMEMQLSSLPLHIFAVPFGAVGFSNTVFGGAPLPASLDAIGAPGCSLFISIDQEFSLSNQSGTAAWNIGVPFDTSLLGLNAYLQGAVFAPGHNPANLVVTNAAHVVVGSY